jgi:RNA polymerase sigma-70 factor (ECF subfamily)
MSDERYRGSRSESSPDAVAADLAERFTLRLRLFALRRLRDPAAAEDTVQDALREVLKALRAGRIANPEALPGFVFQTAKNLCMHHGRSAGRRDRALLAFGRLPQDGGPDPLLAVIDEERRAAVRAALARLEKDDRDVLALTFEEELDAAEVGLRLGLAAGTVRVRKHRALRRLAELLGASRSNETEGAGTP